MRVPFIKMHGLGNDFVVLDARDERAAADRPPRSARGAGRPAHRDRLRPADRARAVRPRPTSACASSMPTAARSRPAAMPAARSRCCTASRRGSRPRAACSRSSPADGGIAVDMGEPRFEWDAIPLAYAMDTLDDAGRLGRARAARSRSTSAIRTSVFFVPDCDAVAARPARPGDRARPAVSRAHQRQRRHGRRTATRSACGCGSAAPA